MFFYRMIVILLAFLNFNLLTSGNEFFTEEELKDFTKQIARGNYEFIRDRISDYKARGLVPCPEIFQLLVRAFFYNQNPIFEFLLEYTSIPNRVDGHGRTLLGRVCEAGRHNMAITLLNDSRMGPNNMDNDDTTVLMWAAKFNRTRIIEELLKRGAHPNPQDTYGMTALMWACKMKHGESVRLLIASPTTKLNLLNKWKESALWIAACEKDNQEIVRMLVSKGADLNLQARSFLTE